jgi:cyclophilin family peptidyl-prolyl cis-trans isomerase
MHRLTIFLFTLLLGLSTAVGADDSQPRVRLVTSKGDIVLQLDRAKAPKTVENFLRYVQDGHYNGTLFHRVIDGFMIQGGGFDAGFAQKPTRAPILNEADNGLRNTIGTIAMARTGDPHSATAQFFINVANNDFLDFREKTPRAWGYAVFGRVVSGMDVVKTIKETPTGSGGPFHKDVPQEPVVIQQALVITGDAAK